MEETQEKNNEIIEKLEIIENNINKKFIKKLDQLENERKNDFKVNIFISVILSFVSGIVVAFLFFIKQSSTNSSPILLYDTILFIGVTISFIFLFNYIYKHLDEIRDFLRKNK